MLLRDIQWEEMLLVSSDDLLDGSQQSLPGIVAMGKPFIYDAVKRAAATESPVDGEIALMLGKHDFTYMRLPVTLRPVANHDLRFCGVDVRLHGMRNAETICWSMAPMRIDQEVKLKTESKITAGLQLKALAETSLKASSAATEEYVVYDSLIEAFNLNRADPAWELQPATGRQLRGIYLLEMVVRSERGARSFADITLRADIFRKGFIYNYKVQRSSDKTPMVRFTLR